LIQRIETEIEIEELIAQLSSISIVMQTRFQPEELECKPTRLAYLGLTHDAEF